MIEHDTDAGSLLSHHKPRRAPLFLGDEISGLAIDFKRNYQMVCDAIPVFDSVEGRYLKPLGYYRNIGYYERTA